MTQDNSYGEATDAGSKDLVNSSSIFRPTGRDVAAYFFERFPIPFIRTSSGNKS